MVTCHYDSNTGITIVTCQYTSGIVTLLWLHARNVIRYNTLPVTWVNAPSVTSGGNWLELVGLGARLDCTWAGVTFTSGAVTFTSVTSPGTVTMALGSVTAPPGGVTSTRGVTVEAGVTLSGFVTSRGATQKQSYNTKLLRWNAAEKNPVIIDSIIIIEK